MGHTPFGYRIENGIAVIDETASKQIQQLYKSYLQGLSLETTAKEAGIVTYHGTVRRILENKRYLGDSFYPAIIDAETYRAAQQERRRRAERLGRTNLLKRKAVPKVPVSFSLKPVVNYYDNPVKQAEYLYSLIESEAR
jgi:hypothetical protein